MKDTDAQLINRWRNHADSDALEALLRKYENAVYSFALRMTRDPHSAEDVAQETLVRAVQHLPRYRETGRFKSWLFRITYREALRQLDRKHRRDEIPWESVGEHPPPHPARTPADVAADRDQTSYMESLVTRLPEEERAVVLMRVHGDMKFKEIAAAIDCPLNTVLSRMHRATVRLRKWIETETGNE